MPRDPDALPENDPRRVLGRVLREIRLRQELTLAAVGERLGSSAAVVRDWEIARRTFGAHEWVRVAEAYGVAPEGLAAEFAAALKPPRKKKAKPG